MALAHAERFDRFVQRCNECPINRLARVNHSYTAWNDQSLAMKAKSFLQDYKDVSVLIVNPTAEGGMPHTRAPSLICLPAYYSESKLEETIKHELVHISQRKNASLWLTRAKIEGWEPVNESEIPKAWLSRCRLNPDTAAVRFFAWEGRHVPLPLFIREDKPELRDIQVRWYDKEEGIVKTAVPTSFTQKYGTLGASSIEHPYELWAYHPQKYNLP
jgi:hypothetical protein